MWKKTIWLSLLILSLLGSVSLTLGFIRAVETTIPNKSMEVTDKVDYNQSKTTEPVSIEKGNDMYLLILGDSLAKGTGDEAGLGIGGYLLPSLQQLTDKNVQVRNLGVDGLTTSQLLREFDNGIVQSNLEIADIIVVSIGGNDIRHRLLRPNNSENLDVTGVIREYTENLNNIIANIREYNASGTILFLGLYNPYNLEDLNLTVDILHQWNSITQLAIGSDKAAVFIPSYDLFKWNIAEYISFDRLHPNSAGYKAIAQRMEEAIKNLVK